MTDADATPAPGSRPAASLLRVMVKDTAVSLAARVVTLALGVLFTAYAARYLGVADWGVISAALAFVTLFQVLGDLGLSQVATREIARDPSLASGLLGNAATVKIALSLVLFGAVVLVGRAIGYSGAQLRVAAILALNVIFASYSGLAYALYQARQRLEYRALAQVLNSCLMLAGALWVIQADWGVLGLAAVYAVSSVCVLGLNVLVLERRFLRLRPRFDVGVSRRMLRTGMPFSATLFISGFFLQLDLILLSLFMSEEAAGLYGAAVTVITVATFVAEAVVLATFPVTSRLFVQDRRALQKAIDRSAKYLLIVGTLLACGGILQADVIIRLIYGDAFRAAVLPLQLLCVYLPIRFVSHVLSWALPSIDREPLRTLSALVAALVNFVLDVLLIPRLGLIGTALASIASQMVLFAMYSHFLGKYLDRLHLGPVAWRALLASVAMALVVVGLGRYLHFAVVTALGVVAYVIVLCFLRTLDSQDLRVAQELISQLRGRPTREAVQ